MSGTKQHKRHGNSFLWLTHTQSASSRLLYNPPTAELHFASLTVIADASLEVDSKASQQQIREAYKK